MQPRSRMMRARASHRGKQKGPAWMEKRAERGSVLAEGGQWVLKTTIVRRGDPRDSRHMHLKMCLSTPARRMLPDHPNHLIGQEQGLDPGEHHVWW